MSTLNVNVVVQGAGPAGACAALNLAPHHRVLLLDRQPRPLRRIGESLPPAARRLLDDMGLWEDFLRQGHAPCHGNRSAWGGLPTEHDFLRDLDGHGWHLDRAQFEQWLRQHAVWRGAALLAPATITAVAGSPDGWQLELRTTSGPTQVRARVLIDAGGRAATLARWLGAHRAVNDALVCGWVYGRDFGGEAMRSRVSRPASRDGGIAQRCPAIRGYWPFIPTPTCRRHGTCVTRAGCSTPPQACRK